MWEARFIRLPCCSISVRIRGPISKAREQHPQTIIQPCMWFLEVRSQFSNNTKPNLFHHGETIYRGLRMLLSCLRKRRSGQDEGGTEGAKKHRAGSGGRIWRWLMLYSTVAMNISPTFSFFGSDRNCLSAIRGCMHNVVFMSCVVHPPPPPPPMASNLSCRGSFEQALFTCELNQNRPIMIIIFSLFILP